VDVDVVDVDVDEDEVVTGEEDVMMARWTLDALIPAIILQIPSSTWKMTKTSHHYKYDRRNWTLCSVSPLVCVVVGFYFRMMMCDAGASISWPPRHATIQHNTAATAAAYTFQQTLAAYLNK
jgi:hypothetical protein